MKPLTRRAGFGLLAGVVLAGGVLVLLLTGVYLDGAKPQAQPAPAGQDR